MNLAFGRGLDQRAPETALAPGFVRDAVNLDIAPGQYAQKVPLGHARTRIGRTLVHASAAIGGCWSDPRVGFGLFVDGTALVRLAPDGERTTLATVTASSLCAEFVPEQGAVYWSTGAESGRIVAGASIAWGLPEPAAPALSAGVGACRDRSELELWMLVDQPCGDRTGEPGSARDEDLRPDLRRHLVETR